jgi:cytochrome c6
MILSISSTFKVSFSYLLFVFILGTNTYSTTIDDKNSGKKLFLSNCNVCHLGGQNIIIPEKNLKKETLQTNGMYSREAISYQILNGKNGMPAFGGRLKENEIKLIAEYVLQNAKET